MPMLFFRSAPPTTTDTAKIQQWLKVREYHDRMAPRGMLFAYADPHDFEDKLRQSIQQHLHQIEPVAAGKPAAPAASTPFAVRYRARLRPLHADWDLSGIGVALAGASRPQHVRLDDIYQRLRLAEGYNLQDISKGEPIEPESLLSRTKPLLIRGPAGAGKTTWARWMFRRLLEREDELPLYLALRDLAKEWADHGEKSFDKTLALCAGEKVDAPEGLIQAIGEPSGPTPILIIDGWDELGDLGRKLRERLLGFLGEHKHVRVIVTSRPYGDHVPDENVGFEVLDLQPLNEDEIRAFAQRFHALEDSALAEKRASDFWEALSRSQQAGDLARTPLLLTMMLGLSRTRTLPEKRHELYFECLKAMIRERPKQQANEGARDWEDLPDGEERFRVTAALAWNLQSNSKDGWQGPLVAQPGQMIAFLPDSWERSRKELFLDWLCDRAAVMNRRSDGTLAFVHRSFQEFLTAWDRHQQLDPTAREEFALKWSENGEWWETLRLWAALLEGEKGRPALRSVHSALQRTWSGEALSGAILADGLSDQETFEEWARQFAITVRTEYRDLLQSTAAAWRSCTLTERRATIPALWFEAAKTANWMEWLRMEEWLNDAGVTYGSLREPFGVATQAVLSAIKGDMFEEQCYGYTRILTGATPLWPEEPVELALLALWPSARRLVGLHLQTASTTAGDGPLSESMPISQFTPAQVDPNTGSQRVADLVGDLRQALPPGVEGTLAQDLARDLARDLVLYLAPFKDRDEVRPLLRDLIRNWAHLTAEHAVQVWTQDLARNQARISVANFARKFTRVSGMWTLGSLWRAAARTRAATIAAEPYHPAVKLARAACRLSLEHRNSKRPFATALRAYERSPNPDPLWPALARHIARRSTEADRDLLIDLAKHPEKREPPLRWGLQYLVRGDVMLEDGSVIQLDDLSREHGLEPLPYLEDMPPELKID